ncbi:fumarylacetoacetate hydrolase family protein [Pseudonocardia kujensis]|uniref:fumarylacetoacetate hydrolase family protein n=1 Tax=Pseudonocardia kujensis TaxID=1128675 RepID=UPI001E4825CE|nr:fumarylacetoacetate hydrolase family protein [Pseudonocardia kujensis]MCE0764909.1 fumarylacetoacetate hydrolase family protein [Pseudonocardia kujensis]
MRLIGFTAEDGERWIAARDGDKARPLAPAGAFYADARRYLDRPTEELVDVASLDLAPAVPITARIFCVGINYRSHAGESKELAGLDEPALPMIFGRWQQSLVVEGTPVPAPPNEAGLDWEVELAAVIGSPVWRGDEATALDHVLGYAAFNDLSARRKQLETPQFTIGKNADLSGPISEIVTADEVGDISAGLRVTTHVNGELMQDGNTRDLIHTVPRIIAYITDTLTLQPGDVIATGTPGGVGAGRKPPVFLTDGDEVVVTVEQVGSVRTPIVAPRD